jgi:CBS domain-containing protein
VYATTDTSATVNAEWLRGVAPFDRLTADELLEAARALEPSTYGAGETILQRLRPARHLHIVREGAVEEQDTSGVIAHYSPGGIFDYRALAQGRADHDFIAKTKTVCELLPAPVVIALTRRNAGFQAFWQSELARRADALIAVQQQREAASFLLARIADGDLHKPEFVPPSTTLQEAATLMNQRRSSFLLVERDGRIGIFTGRDAREKSLLMGLAGSTPIGELASYDLVTLDKDDFLFNALATMTQHAIRHVVITDGAAIVGVFEQTDLLRYLTDSSFAIANRVERARTPLDLEEAGRSIPHLIEALQGRGVKPRYIARVATNLNRKIFRRLFEQIVPVELRGGACLIVMGSEGRAEQLLPTDQDNAVIFEGEPPHGIAHYLDAFSASLSKLGYPPCPGGIMVSNPAWARSLADFRRDVGHWLYEGKMEGFLNLAILLDAAPVAGEDALLRRLKDHLFDLAKREGTTLGYFARAILNFETPLGFFGRFVTEASGPHEGRIDVKKGGLFPIVHGIRSLALEARLAETNTIARIQMLSNAGQFSNTFAADLIEAFDFMSMLRLRTQLEAWRAGRTPDNHIDPKALSKLDRGLLRDSFKVVKALKSSLSYHFKLDYVS